MSKFFKMNLRPFMDELDSGGGAVASSQETTEPTESTESTVDTSTEASTESTEPAEKQSEGTIDASTEVAETKPKQSPEQDRAYADLRRKAEAAERRAVELETQRQSDREIAKKFGQYGVYSDADVAEKYGKSHGLSTVAEFEKALQLEEHQDRQEALKASGVDPELLNKFVDEHPAMQKAKEQEARALAQEQAAAKVQLDHFLVESFSELSKEFSEIAKPEDVPPEVWKVWRNGESGISLKQAYAAVNYESIASRKAEAAKQATLNNIQSKGHIRGNGSGVEGETVRIPDDVMDMYKRFNPGKSMEEYRAHYKKGQK